MSTKTHNFRIGIFVITGIALLVAGLLAFGAKSYFARKTTFETAIQGDVFGLSVGSKVMFRGVPVGKVSNIDFAVNLYPSSKSEMIVVEFEADRQVYMADQTAEKREARRRDEVAKGLRAMVKGQGITGTSILALERLNPEEYPPPTLHYQPRHPYIPSAPGQFTRIIESVEQSLRNFEKLNFESIDVGASNTLTEATRLLEKLNQNTIGKADRLLDHLDTAVGDVNATVKSMKLDALSRHADELMVELKETNTKLELVLDHVGAVPMGETVDDFRSAAQTLDAVLIDMKGYPSGFIFGKPPLPAQSVDEPGSK